MIGRSAWMLVLLGIATIGVAVGAPIHKARPIAIFINGSQLRVDPAPVFYKHQLVVPVRRIIEALGLDYQRSGTTIVTHAGYKTIALQIGSARASVDGEPILMEIAPVEIKGTLFASLRFFTAALGAQAIFNRKAARVEITDSRIGRSGNGIS
ncbi:MAG: copper amine oxidase N-terminal domain-containing protein, partial [Candidatus Baltobacteraceae bacterium]